MSQAMKITIELPTLFGDLTASQLSQMIIDNYCANCHTPICQDKCGRNSDKSSYTSCHVCFAVNFCDDCANVSINEDDEDGFNDDCEREFCCPTCKEKILEEEKEEKKEKKKDDDDLTAECNRCGEERKDEDGCIVGERKWFCNKCVEIVVGEREW